jgi:hypothetical protein
LSEALVDLDAKSRGADCIAPLKLVEQLTAQIFGQLFRGRILDRK